MLVTTYNNENTRFFAGLLVTNLFSTSRSVSIVMDFGAKGRLMFEIKTKAIVTFKTSKIP